MGSFIGGREELKMRHPVLFIILAFALVSPFSVTGSAQLIHEEGSEVTFDADNGRYWYYDITRFSDMTYEEQVAEISTINVEGLTGPWRMATYEEMAALWEHSAESIFYSFSLTMNDDHVAQWYTLGRYDEAAKEGSHYFAHVERTGENSYEKSVLNYLDYTPDSLDFEILGAWVIFEGEVPAGDLKMVCATLGDGTKGFGSDTDVFSFKGTEGDVVTIRLEAHPPESGAGKRVMLVVRNMTGALQLFRRLNRPLPHEMTLVLPISDDYQVLVGESPETPADTVIWGEKYSGDYCVLIEGSPEAAETFKNARSVE
jgi:hypothetical protein